ncbi:hypothetical protein LSCM1_04001 [Leishmania martiniquensis]|uniref:Ribosomal P protein AGP2beta-1 n=1 Tax=Leishmania martiniquensis TaxID=1580590 RepID=A0A836KJ61_9TRYP|nr:hypothetical protein LSCM1_04001 [Leishmania martiniquensis]
MALQENKDSYEVKALSLSEFVLQCSYCHQLCLEKTARVVENSSRAPRGWESVFHSVAEERRSEDLGLCESRCKYMHDVCPSQAKVQKYEEALAAAAPKARKSTPPSASVLQEASRCEHAVEAFSSVLFALAHKPSKVSFPTKGPQEGTTYGELRDGPPTEAHRKALEGVKKAQNVTLSGWSKAPSEHVDGEKHDSSSPAESIYTPKTAGAFSPSSGTLPKW